MNQLEAFKATVQSDPLNAVLRGAYADCLDEEGMVEEASRQREFVPAYEWVKGYAQMKYMGHYYLDHFRPDDSWWKLTDADGKPSRWWKSKEDRDESMAEAAKDPPLPEPDFQLVMNALADFVRDYEQYECFRFSGVDTPDELYDEGNRKKFLHCLEVLTGKVLKKSKDAPYFSCAC